jgi:acyl transferase domain-containing protein
VTVSAEAPAQSLKVVMVFTGQGAQWPQMGADLIIQDPDFKADIAIMNDVLQRLKNPAAWS